MKQKQYSETQQFEQELDKLSNNSVYVNGDGSYSNHLKIIIIKNQLFNNISMNKMF